MGNLSSKKENPRTSKSLNCFPFKKKKGAKNTSDKSRSKSLSFSFRKLLDSDEIKKKDVKIERPRNFSHEVHLTCEMMEGTLNDQEEDPKMIKDYESIRLKFKENKENVTVFWQSLATFFDKPTERVGNAICVMRYEANYDHELSMSFGDDITVLDDSQSDWWHGINNDTGRDGYFPSRLVKITNMIQKEHDSRDRRISFKGSPPFDLLEDEHDSKYLSPPTSPRQMRLSRQSCKTLDIDFNTTEEWSE